MSIESPVETYIRK